MVGNSRSSLLKYEQESIPFVPFDSLRVLRATFGAFYFFIRPDESPVLFEGFAAYLAFIFEDWHILPSTAILYKSYYLGVQISRKWRFETAT